MHSHAVVPGGLDDLRVPHRHPGDVVDVTVRGLSVKAYVGAPPNRRTVASRHAIRLGNV
ncbi:hypothetical protein GCM10023094_03760 [Rhodococcus olei]|uniref:Uncharacterized protein n=1 Tax=Rhodococcus olei TaxID=2161675 RepID=A0ABP8NS76_9NOCA